MEIMDLICDNSIHKVHVKSTALITPDVFEWLFGIEDWWVINIFYHSVSNKEYIRCRYHKLPHEDIQEQSYKIFIFCFKDFNDAMMFKLKVN